MTGLSFWIDRIVFRQIYLFCLLYSCADPEWGTGGPDHKAIWRPSNTGPDPLLNHRATKLAFNGGPSRPVSETFRWRAGDGR